MFTLLGSSKCKVLSVLDLKDTFHSLRLTENSKKYCGILPYFGSTSYLYQRMPMGLNISPAVWQSYINAILSCLSSRKYCEAVMDDFLLFTPTKESHFSKLEDLLKALCKNWLKISPKKYQLFKTELQYMGNTIFIKDTRVCVKPLRSRLEAIQILKPPTMVKGCRSFAGMVNSVSISCPELQKLLKPIYDLTMKGRHFIWGEEQQVAFEELKSRLQKPPVPHMPNRRGIFLLYSDTSKHATGSALYQVQDGKPKHTAYASKRMPEAAKNYCITELEMCGLAINIASFAHLFKRVDFNAIVDHLAITHIMKSKMEPTTNRIKRLLELLSSYSFNLYYMKGKDMVLSDFLLRQQVDDSDPHEIIPISFNMRETLKQKYYKVEEAKFLVQTRSQTKLSSGIKLPAVHGTTKTLVPHEIPEKQPSGINRPRIGQGIPGIKRKVRPISNETPKPVETRPMTHPIMQLQGATTMRGQLPHVQVYMRQPIGPRLEMRETPPYINPIMRPPPRPPDLNDNNRRDSRPNLITDPNIDFEENSLHQEGIISETYESQRNPT